MATASFETLNNPLSLITSSQMQQAYLISYNSVHLQCLDQELHNLLENFSAMLLYLLL